jgi:hypothetical protein
MEEPKGASHNPFSIMSLSDISEIALDTGVVLGSNALEKDKSLLELIEKDSDRKVAFDKTCPSCQVDSGVE